ncbi:hypothetical protein BOTBODRAFT_27688 [Botryobasidium botryosum FD-172 SS1]|uniref:Pali-domain-containing protein n=1 Tax=Botryobasidium botryosum (strain FD-172 SS1) TaxID=930990 RepID=A0A067N922_BOTB1|nr:hypothetical protein BOTBODRAFT_27688 [Botryobasidium botryosum FD-172 SS1]
MSCWRPATPGFITTLTATILLVVVSFSVPWFKTVYFLKASLAVENINGTITFGVLGYCLELSGNTTCSKAAVGYELDINKLVGNNLPIQIPTVVVKWITYALVLHIVALILSAIAAVFGLLAHIREMSMTCFSSCISGFAASVALLAFIFDLVLFFLAKARLNKVPGGSATMGNAIWLTLAAWILLFISGCMFSFGRCCISDRPRPPRGPKRERSLDKDTRKAEEGYSGYAETMRLDAVKAEADRKAKQRLGPQEVGLPAFHEHERQPLRSASPQYLEEDEPSSPYRDHAPRPANVSVATTAGVAGVGAMQREASVHTTHSAPRRQPTNEGPLAHAGLTPPVPRVEQYPEKQFAAASPSPAQGAYTPQPYQQPGASSSVQDPYSHPALQGSAPTAYGGYQLQDTYGQQQQRQGSYGHPSDPSYYSTNSQQPQHTGYASSYGPAPDYTSQPDYSAPQYQPYQPQTSNYSNTAAAQLYDFNSNPYASPPPQAQAHPQPAADPYSTYNSMYSPHPGPPVSPTRQQSGPRGPRSPTMPPGF